MASPSRLNSAVGVASLAALAAGSVVVSGAAMGLGQPYVLEGPDASSWFLGPLTFAENGWGRTGALLAVGAMFAGYVGLLRTAAALGRRPVLAGLAALHLWFVLGPVLFSSDVIFYLGLGQVWALDGLDPYAVGRVAGARAGELSVYTPVWEGLTSTYGPAFTALTAGFALLGPTGAVWAFKILVAAGAGATLYLVWRLAGRLGRDRLFAVVFVGANPLWLAWTVAGVHNDTLMTAALVGAAMLIAESRAARAGVVIALASAVKLSLAPFAALALLGAERKRRLLLAGALVLALVLAIGFVLFPSSWLGHWLRQSQDQALLPGPGPLTWTAGILGMENDPVALRVRTGAQYLGLLVVGAMMIRTWRGGDWITAAGWATLAILLTTSWLREWYVAWLLPLAALSGSPRLIAATIALTGAVVLLSDIGP